MATLLGKKPQQIILRCTVCHCHVMHMLPKDKLDILISSAWQFIY